MRRARSSALSSGVAEQRDLAGHDVFLLERCLTNRSVECGRELRAVSTKRIEGARVNQRLENALVAHAKIDARRKIEDAM